MTLRGKSYIGRACGWGVRRWGIIWRWYAWDNNTNEAGPALTRRSGERRAQDSLRRQIAYRVNRR